MSKFQNIIDSFSIQKTLNPKVWENPENPDKSKMIPKVRKALMRISEKFIDYLGDDIFVEDVVLTGSLSNFNWSEYSDFDLHVYVDLSQYGKQSDLYKELFNLKKQVFNKNHDIKIFKYDVELYAQDTEEEHVSSGVYSVMNDEWINKPKKVKTDINKKILEKKIKSWTDKIDRALEPSTDEKTLENLKEKLKEYRKSGLESEGELSYENLVFKFLRRSGHIERLFNTADKVVDKELSVERKLEEQDDKSEDKSVNYLKIVNSSPFLKSFKEMTDEARSYEFTPGIKLPYSKDVELIQTALQFLGFSLPKWGVDGKYGPETEKSVISFQQKYNIPITGKVTNTDLQNLLAGLIKNNFKDSDLSNIRRNKEFDTSGSNIKDWEGIVKLIIENLEGGYYHPNMLKDGRVKDSRYGKSGETMFGLDRKAGQTESTGPAGVEFWKIIDNENASKNWKWNYMAKDNPALYSKLVSLAAQIMKPEYEKYCRMFLSPQSSQIVNNNGGLLFNFAYATWNGPGWFKKFATVINESVDSGITDPKELLKIVLDRRSGSSNSLVAQGANEISKIANALA
jgi:hypothetical protein